MDNEDIRVKINVNAKNTKSEVKSLNEDLKNTKGILNDIKSGVSTAFKVGNIASFAKMLKGTLDTMMKSAKPQSDYINNIKMMNIAFGEGADGASKFVARISEMTGLDPAPLTKQISLYRQIGASMKIPSEQADILSNNLLQLQLDMTSYFTDMSFEKAGTLLTSALTGNAKALKDFGVSINNTSLQQELYRLGIDRNIRTLTQSERTIISSISIQRQLSNINGDLATTINSVSNQMQVWTQQISQLARNIGGFLMPILQTILPYLNAILMVINNIIVAIQKFFGIDAKKIADDLKPAGGGIGAISDGLDGIEKSAKKANKSLRGFDKLNVITTPTESPSGAGAGGGVGGGISSDILDALDKQKKAMLDIKSRATEIAEEIMKWIGFGKNAKDEWEYIGGRFDKIVESIKNLAGSIASFFSSVINFGGVLLNTILKDLFEWAIDTTIPLTLDMIALAFEGVAYILDIITALWTPLYENVIQPFGEFMGTILTPIMEGSKKAFKDVVGVLKDLKEWVEKNKEKIDEFLKPVKEWLEKAKEWISENETLNWWLDKLGWLLGAFAIAIGVVSGAVLIFNVVMGIATGIAGALAGAVAFLTSPFGIAVLAITALIAIGVLLYKNWETIKEKAVEIFTKLKSILEPIFKSIGNFFIGMINNMVEGLNFFIKTALTPLNLLIKGLNIPLKALGLKTISEIKIEIPKIPKLEDGGFLDKGQLFVANEKGAEMVGSMDGKTAVANQQQIVEGISLGVAKGMRAGSTSTKVEITAEGDSSGLLNFIKFAQKEDDRQYGF